MLFWPDHPAFQTGLGSLKGVGPKTLSLLNQAGLYSTGDLLVRIPRFYQDRRQFSPIGTLEDGASALVAARIISARAAFSRRGRRRYLTAQAEDSSGRLTLLWFNAPAYLLKSLSKGRPVFLFGRARLGDRGPEMIHPDLEFPSEKEEKDFPSAGGRGLQPIYAPIGPLSSGQVAKLLAQALELLADCPGPPADWLARYHLSDPVRALSTLHCPPAGFPGPPPRPEDSRAWAALAFWELLFWRLMMLKAKERPGEPVRADGLAEGRRVLERFWDTLPFAPSSEQRRVVEEILADLDKGLPLSRLLQGEVGGGKTAVAGALIFFTLGQGAQAALMAPTEVLARQHFEFLAGRAAALGYTAALLVGGQSEKEKKEVRRALAEGRIGLIIGTQALAASGTMFRNLGLAVIDEQHRFGVRQRLMLRRKNQRVGLLSLSATPIPRSLALMLYGDLDHSRLTGLLPGRRPPRTELFPGGRRDLAMARFLELLGREGQGFVVTPRIGDRTGAWPDPEPEGGGLEETQRELAALAGPEVTMARLHGRLPAAEQETIVEDFRRGRIQILLATSIIEVGVDVPAARVILIDGADRFGLAQLHQLRGRVGRDGREAHCLVLPGAEPTAQGQARLLALSRETDGQILAELDLQLRGPGEELGLRQSGWPALHFARLPRDLALLDQAHQLAEKIRSDREWTPCGWLPQDAATWPAPDQGSNA